MRAPLLAVSALVLGTLVSLSGGAQAADNARTTVTIQAEGTDLSGKVLSPKPAKCVDGRKVIVMKQKGAKGGDNDKKIATDTAAGNGDWSTGNTGMTGKFYAKVKKIDGCKGDTSKTITVQQLSVTRASGKFRNKVTIDSDMSFSGRVTSERPAKCAKERRVQVFRQKGTQGGKNDDKVAAATTQQDGDVYYWSVLTKVAPGEYYAKIKETDKCRAATSKTMTLGNMAVRTASSAS